MLRRFLLLPLLLLLLCGAFASCAAALPTYQEVRHRYHGSDALITDRSGAPLGRIRLDFDVRRGDWLELADISVALQRAIIQSEDQRFYAHDGVDWRAVLAAAWGNMAHGQRRGASTLSMQVVGMIDEQFARERGGRSLMRKVDQARQAGVLEAAWSKAEILETYLNLAAFRGELAGVDALARVMFQKHASGIDGREAALAAVLLRAPNASVPMLQERACGLLVAMGRAAECKGLSLFLHQAVQRVSWPWADTTHLAPHLGQWLAGRALPAAGETMRTTIDINLQRFALESVNRHLHVLGMANVSDAAVVVLENRTGKVLAYVGSSGDLSTAGQVDHARALRQAGSTLKPFLYAQAIAEQRVTTVSLLENNPLDLPTGNGLYIPQNYDMRFSGWVSVRTALSSSLNIPAVRTLLMVTPEALTNRLRALGLPLDQAGDFYGYSLALGSADVTLLSLTNAYRAFADGGRYSAPQFFADAVPVPKSQQIMSPGASWIVADILADRHARAATFGLDGPLSTPFWTAVKTGTSKDMRDNWCLGWSQHYTVGVWVGNSGGASMQDVSGVSGAGPIWHDIMARLHRFQSSVPAPMPTGVVRQDVTFQNAVEPARTDVFLGDTSVSHVALASVEPFAPSRMPFITEPAHGTILAMDPDIPAAHQRRWLQATNALPGRAQLLQWRVNRRIVGRGDRVGWAPAPGYHRIDLVDERGTLLDTTEIQVRSGVAR